MKAYVNPDQTKNESGTSKTVKKAGKKNVQIEFSDEEQNKEESSEAQEKEIQPTTVRNEIPPEVQDAKKIEEQQKQEKLKQAELERQQALAEKALKEKADKEKLRLEKEQEEKERREKQAALLQSQKERENKPVTQTKVQVKPGKSKQAEFQFEDEDEFNNELLPEAHDDHDDSNDVKTISELDQQNSVAAAAKKEKSTVEKSAVEKAKQETGKKAKKQSFHFEDEDEITQNKKDEDEAKEAENNASSNLKIVDSKETPLMMEDLKKEAGENEEKKGVGLALTLFVIVLMGSLFLWIFLFRLLALKNAHLKSVMLDLPTLGQYHEKYTNFYLAYNQNTDNMINSVGLLGKATSGPNLQQRESLFGLFKAKEDLTLAVAKVKERLSHLSRGERQLAESGEKQATLLESVQAIGSKLQEFQEKAGDVKDLPNKFEKFYDQILINLRNMYKESLEMVDLYGEFYYMTHRIWVASDNIFRLFDYRANEVNHEMLLDHYEPLEVTAQKIELKTNFYSQMSKVNTIPVLSIVADRETNLICNVKAEIDNQDFQSLEKSFEMKLVRNGNESGPDEPFVHKIKAKKDLFTFVQNLPLVKGANTVEIFAKVRNGDIKLDNFIASCIKFSDYSKIPEYRDFRIA